MAITLKRYDGCLTTPDSDLGSFGISDHGYQYSMGVGDAWSVKYPVIRLVPLAQRPYTRPAHQTSATHPEQYAQHWRGGTAYNYGIGAARYPVPALALEVWRLPKRIVIVQEHDGGEFWQETYSFPAR